MLKSYLTPDIMALILMDVNNPICQLGLLSQFREKKYLVN